MVLPLKAVRKQQPVQNAAAHVTSGWFGRLHWATALAAALAAHLFSGPIQRV